jgi:UrcA family protein
MTIFLFDATSTRRYMLMITAVTACLAAGCASADIDRDYDVPKVVVSLAGIDLSTPAGAKAVYGRIRSAAESVCGVNQSRDLVQVRQARACFQSSVDDAIARVDRPLLSALHERRMGNQPEMIRAARR